MNDRLQAIVHETFMALRQLRMLHIAQKCVCHFPLSTNFFDLTIDPSISAGINSYL